MVKSKSKKRLRVCQKGQNEFVDKRGKISNHELNRTDKFDRFNKLQKRNYQS